MKRIMSVDELNPRQLRELKRRYLDVLSDEGILYEVLFDEPEKDDDADGVPAGFYDDIDNIVDDALVFGHYRDYAFTDDDFGE